MQSLFEQDFISGISVTSALEFVVQRLWYICEAELVRTAVHTGRALVLQPRSIAAAPSGRTRVRVSTLLAALEPASGGSSSVAPVPERSNMPQSRNAAAAEAFAKRPAQTAKAQARAARHKPKSWKKQQSKLSWQPKAPP